MANNFLPFAPTDTGTNLLSQGDYAVAPDRTIGNQPGVASSRLVNKAIRQSAYMVSQVAQYVADRTGTDLLDDATPAKLLAQLNATLYPLAPSIQRFLTGSGNYNMTYVFFIATGSATAGATYTNNAVTFTVVETVASGLQLRMTGNADPQVSGTLTKASGTGDATLTFYARRKPIALDLILVGGGGGGAAGITYAAGSNGGNTTFGASGLIAGGGVAASTNIRGTGGTYTATVGSLIHVTEGGDAQSGGTGGSLAGQGGTNPMGCAGGAGYAATQSASSAKQNSGAGGGGGGGNGASNSGGGGGAGAYIHTLISNPASTYAYTVGAGGAGGINGTGNGGNGGSGVVIVRELYQ